VDPLLDHLRETIDTLRSEGAELRWIVETHSHGDHLSGASALQRRAGGEIVAHPGAPGEVATVRPPDGARLALGEHALVVRHAPGVTQDALVLEGPGVYFTGDTLLIGTVGLRDAPGSDGDRWFESLRRIFSAAAEEAVIHPGHDDMGRSLSTVRAERTGNRWLREDDREAFLTHYREDTRRPRKDAERILEANRTGLLSVPSDLAPASGISTPAEVAERAHERAARRPPEKDTPLAPPSEGRGFTLTLAGGLCALGTVAGWMLHPAFHALSLVSALLLLGIGLQGIEARRRRRARGEPAIYYEGPTRIGIGD
jgi:glyoxylase-like metal-dependent hydrolase (beta-lactamase superfamily II)